MDGLQTRKRVCLSLFLSLSLVRLISFFSRSLSTPKAPNRKRWRRFGVVVADIVSSKPLLNCDLSSFERSLPSPSNSKSSSPPTLQILTRYVFLIPRFSFDYIFAVGDCLVRAWLLFIRNWFFFGNKNGKFEWIDLFPWLFSELGFGFC